VKALLAKLTPHKGIGLFIDEHEVVVSQIASTPLGLVELTSQRRSYADYELPEAIQRLLGPIVDSNKRIPPIVVGLSTRRVFYSTRPMKPDGNTAAPQALLREVLQSPNICIDEMAVEISKGEFSKRKLVSVASCRKEYLFGLLQTLKNCQVQPFRTEPAPLALLRAGAARRRVRKSKPAIRIFLNDTDALAVVTAGSVCLLWKSFKLTKGSEPSAVGAAIRSCQSLIRHCGIEMTADVVVVHGRADLRAQLTAEEFTDKAGVQVVCSPEPVLDGAAVAYGLALGCIQDQGSDALDMTKSITPSPSLWRVFPWGEAAIQVALIVCMGLFMTTRSHSAEKIVQPVRAELQRHAWVGKKSQADLVKEKQELTAKVDSVRKFVTTRVLWTKYTHDVSERLPDEATLIAFQGISEMEQSGKGKSKPKKSFLIRATAPVPEDGTAPKQIDQFLSALRNHPLLQQDFPVVELADIKTAQATRNQEATTLFTVLCLPKQTKPAAEPQPAKKGAH
jgi:hypothetical protein